MKTVMTQLNVEAVLCYVSDQWAFFTTQPLDKQTGDDWDDAPYEHNAGGPYTPSERYQRYNHETKQWEEGSDYIDGVPDWEIVCVAWSGALVTPKYNHWNSPWSVERINEGAIPWLRTDEWWQREPVAIMAGTTLRDFDRLVRQAGGQVYYPGSLEEV